MYMLLVILLVAYHVIINKISPRNDKRPLNNNQKRMLLGSNVTDPSVVGFVHFRFVLDDDDVSNCHSYCHQEQLYNFYIVSCYLIIFCFLGPVSSSFRLSVIICRLLTFYMCMKCNLISRSKEKALGLN